MSRTPSSIHLTLNVVSKVNLVAATVMLCLPQTSSKWNNPSQIVRHFTANHRPQASNVNKHANRGRRKALAADLSLPLASCLPAAVAVLQFPSLFSDYAASNHVRMPAPAVSLCRTCAYAAGVLTFNGSGGSRRLSCVGGYSSELWAGKADEHIVFS